MNTVLPHRWFRRLLVLFFGLGCLHLFAAAAAAAPCVDVSGSLPVLQANLLYELFADRTRMIQVTLVFVALGCALIWWYR